MPQQNAFAPWTPNDIPDIGGSFLKGAQVAGNLRTQDNQNALAHMQIQDYQENRGARNSLNTAHTSLYQSQAAEAKQKAAIQVAMTLAGPAQQFDKLYEDALKQTGDPQAATAAVQPQYQKFIARLDRKSYTDLGLTIDDNFDPQQNKIFIQQAAQLKKASASNYHAPVPTTEGYINPNEGNSLIVNPKTNKPFMPPSTMDRTRDTQADKDIAVVKAISAQNKIDLSDEEARYIVMSAGREGVSLDRATNRFLERKAAAGVPSAEPALSQPGIFERGYNALFGGSTAPPAQRKPLSAFGQ